MVMVMVMVIGFYGLEEGLGEVKYLTLSNGGNSLLLPPFGE